MKIACVKELVMAALLLAGFNVPAMAQEINGDTGTTGYAVPVDSTITTETGNPYTPIPSPITNTGSTANGYDLPPYASPYTNTYKGIPGNYNVWNPTTETAQGETITGNSTNATQTQNLNLPQATQGLLAPGSWFGNTVIPSEGGGSGGEGLYRGVDWAMQSGNIFPGVPLPPTSTASLDINIVGD